MIVPCGMCVGCRIDKSRQWAIRCTHEAKFHERNCFLTLTYRDENLPSDLSLSKEHLQQFFRALRYEQGKFRYFAVGEYSKDNRPHYHIILFGLDFTCEDPIQNRKLHSHNDRGNHMFISPVITKIWPYGFHIIGGFNYATAAYTARYVMKKQLGKNSQQRSAYTRFQGDSSWQVQPEFCLMSRRPGIGSQWFEKYHKDAFPSDFLVVSGKKHPVPRFYLDKLKVQNEPTAKSITIKRKKARLEDSANNTPERLYAREECKSASLKNLSRS